MGSEAVATGAGAVEQPREETMESKEGDKAPAPATAADSEADKSSTAATATTAVPADAPTAESEVEKDKAEPALGLPSDVLDGAPPPDPSLPPREAEAIQLAAMESAKTVEVERPQEKTELRVIEAEDAPKVANEEKEKQQEKEKEKEKEKEAVEGEGGMKVEAEKVNKDEVEKEKGDGAEKKEGDAEAMQVD